MRINYAREGVGGVTMGEGGVSGATEEYDSGRGRGVRNGLAWEADEGEEGEELVQEEGHGGWACRGRVRQ